jgi:hypothetical protein
MLPLLLLFAATPDLYLDASALDEGRAVALLHVTGANTPRSMLSKDDALGLALSFDYGVLGRLTLGVRLGLAYDQSTYSVLFAHGGGYDYNTQSVAVGLRARLGLLGSPEGWLQLGTEVESNLLTQTAPGLTPSGVHSAAAILVSARIPGLPLGAMGRAGYYLQHEFGSGLTLARSGPLLGAGAEVALPLPAEQAIDLHLVLEATNYWRANLAGPGLRSEPGVGAAAGVGF